MSAELKVFIDWQNNGNFTDAIDDVTADIQKVDWQLGFRQLWQPIADESRCTVILDNADGRYLPENLSSPLTGLIKPQRRIKIVSRVGSTDTVLWIGWIGSIDPMWKPGEYIYPVKIAGVGIKSMLQEKTVNLPIFTNVTGDVIINAVLDQVQNPPATAGVFILDSEIYGRLDSTAILSEPSAYSDIEVGKTTIPVYGDQKPPKALAVIAEITASEQGRFFISRDGKSTWWNRHHQISDITNDDNVNTQSGDFKPSGLGYEYGKSISNIIRIKLNPRKVGAAPETLWELDSPVTIPPADEVRFDAQLRKANGQFAGSASVANTPTFSSGTALVTIVPNGGMASVILSNASVIIPAVLTALVLSGTPSVAQSKMDIESVDNTSQGLYGQKELSVNLGTLSDYGQAKDVADFELSKRADPQGNVRTLTYSGRKFDGVDNAHMLEWEIGTRLNVVVSEFSQDHDYFVMGGKHTWSPKKLHNTTFNLEPASRRQFMILDDAVYGTLDNNRLAY